MTMLPAGKDPRASHVNFIDVIRGLAALCVAYFHAREILWIGMRQYWHLHPFSFSISSVLAFATFPVIWGSVGVPVFFVVSGYVIHRRAARMLVGSKFEFSSSNFLLRRFIRIYPTLIGAIAVTYVCDTITRGYVDHYKLGDLGWSSLLSNVVAMQGITAKPYGSDYPLWSLAIEIQFYLVYPLALLLRRRIGARSMLLFSLGLSVAAYFGLERNGITAFPQYYFSWWLGAYVADCEAMGRKLPRSWRVWCALAILAGCGLYFTGQELLCFTAWAVGFAMILRRLVERKPAVQKPLYFLPRAVGDFSYSLYAIHQPLIVLASAILFLGVHQESIYWSFLALAAVVVASYGFYLVAERPFIRLLERMGH